MHELLRKSAREVVRLLARGEVSALELIDLVEARVAETDPLVNALPTRCFERARAFVREEVRRRPAEPPPGYLYGLPVAIKDLVDVAGVRTTYGSPIFADHVPERSDASVEMLEAKGAAIVAKSNTPEFGAGAQTFNEVFGTTANPWNTTRTPAGSSGGSAVALATGQVWLASGSDLGGSLRTPASFCSVIGFRPAPGRVAHGPAALPFQTMAVEGPMARNVGDAALFLDAQAGQHRADPLSLPAPEIPFLRAVEEPVAPRRVAVSIDLGLGPVHREVREIVARAAASFQDLGAEVVEDCIDFGDAERMFQALRGISYAAARQPLLERHRDKLKPEVIWNIEKGLSLDAAEIAWAERERGLLYQRTIAFFSRYDLLLTPTAITLPYDKRERYVKEVEGVQFPTYISWVVPALAITLTSCPAISVPCGFSREGLPVGLQIVGPPRGEHKVLAAARLFEALHGLDAKVPIDPREGK